MDAAVTYLIRQQHRNGAFPRIGKVHNYQLLVSHNILEHIVTYLSYIRI